MKESIKITYIIASTLILLAIIGTYVVFNIYPTSSEKILTANGRAEIKIIPDKISLYFNIEGEGENAKIAKYINSEITNQLIEDLIKEGLDRKEIQTLSYNIYEDFDWTPTGRKSRGFKATQTVLIKLSTNDLDKVSKIIDVGVDGKAILNYINFELSQEVENRYRAQAIRLAAEDAKMQANALAEGSGNKLGKLVSISNQDFYYQPWRTYDYNVGISSEENVEMAKSAVSIQPTEQVISAQVSTVYKIK